MTHNNEQEKIDAKSWFYIVGLLMGLFIGVVIDMGIAWTVSLGIVGLLFAGFFLQVFVRGREQR